MKFKIPVKPHIRKFLLFYLGAKYKMRMDDPYGLLLFSLVQSKATNGRREGKLGRYTQNFEVEGSTHRLQKSGYQGLTALSVVHFNNFAESIFSMEFYGLASLYLEEAGPTQYGAIQKAIDKFTAKFGLTPEDIDPMSLRRNFLRQRKAERELREIHEKHAKVA